MKSEKGVTLMSLTIYILLMIIVIAILATVRSNFESNLKEVTQQGDQISEISKFNIYFLQEVKKQGNDISSHSENEILFKTGNKYTFRDNAIYLNDNINIAESIGECVFSYNLVNGKKIVTVKIKLLSGEGQTIEYVLNDENLLQKYEDETDYTVYNEIN